MAKVLGIDEAGRGSVLGPMVIAGALLDETKLQKLIELGVKDSKLIPKPKREQMEKQLKEILDDFIVLKIPAYKIDELRKTTNLNKIEVNKMAEITNTLNPHKVIVDAPQLTTEKFKSYISAKLDKKIEIIAENKADLNYPIVSAASILAKVARDREMDKISETVGKDLGVGYPHDQRSISHIQELIDSGKPLPKYIRQSWNTVENMKKKSSQKNLWDIK